ncbi:transmembrane protein adipocyte-associated 1 [Sarotherodon galilaeus]
MKNDERRVKIAGKDHFNSKAINWRDYISRLAWERLGVPPDKLEEVAGEREVWASLLGLVPPRHGPGEVEDQTGARLRSSGHILGSGVGDEIDHTECVICINDAPTTGYESDVGRHSSVSYVFRNPNEFLRRTDSHSVIIFWGPPYKIRKDPKAAFYGSLQRVSMTYRDISYLTVTPSKMLTFDDLFLRETGYDR